MLSEKKPKLAMIKIMFTVIKYNIFFLLAILRIKIVPSVQQELSAG